MAIERLSDSEIMRRLAAFRADPNATDKLLGDGGNLFVRLRKGRDGSTSSTWMFVFTPRGASVKQKLVLGNFSDYSTGKARAWAAEQRRLLGADANPVTVRQARRRQAMQTRDKTLGSLLDAYVAYLRAAGKASADDVENLFKNHVGDAFRRRPAVEIDYREFVALLNTMTDSKGKAIPRTQAKVRAYLRAAYCVSTRADQQPGLPADLQGFNITTSNNPMINVIANPAGIGGRGKRNLTADEFRAYIEQVEKLPDTDVKRLLLLQVFTGGQRMAQLIAARVMGDQLFIEDRKGKRADARHHYVPLIGRAVALAAKHVPVADIKLNKALVCSCSDAVARISRKMDMNADAANPHAPGTPFSLADIRRTIETLLSAAGVSKDIRGQLQSHGISGVQAAHYDMHSYGPEKTAALLVLHRIIAGAPANVIEMRAAA